ncbi:hypothetical protein D3C81_1376740 [compost metagenome]
MAGAERTAVPVRTALMRRRTRAVQTRLLLAAAMRLEVRLEAQLAVSRFRMLQPQGGRLQAIRLKAARLQPHPSVRPAC